MFRSFLRDVSLYGFGDMISRSIALLFFPLFAHLLSVQDYGRLEFLIAATTVLSILSNAGVGSAVQKFYWDKDLGDADRSAVIGAGIMTSLLSSLTVTGLAIAFVFVFHKDVTIRLGSSISVVTLAILSTLPSQLLQMTLDVLRLRFRSTEFVFLSMARAIFGLSSAVLFIFLVREPILGFFLGQLLGHALTLPVACYRIRHEIRFQGSFAKLPGILKYGLPLAASGIAFWLIDGINRWSLFRMSTPNEAGYFATVLKLGGLIFFATTAFGQAWAPWAFRIRKEWKTYALVFGKMMTTWFGVLSGLAFLLATFGYELLRLLTPTSYWPAAVPLGIASAALAVFGMSQIVCLGITLTFNTRYIWYGSWACVLMNIFLNILLVPRFGAKGSSISMLVSYSMMIFFFHVISQRLQPIVVAWRPLAFYIFVLILGIGLSSPIGSLLSFRQFLTLKICLSVVVLSIISWIVMSTNIRAFFSAHNASES